MRRWAFALWLAGIASGASAVELEDFPALGEFVQEMHARHGFNERDLRQWFAAAEIKEDIVVAITRPREALPWHRYKTGFVTPKLAREGVAYWRRHAPILARAAGTYKVAPEVILAIVGVETHYGRNLGRYRVLDALTTLTVHYPPRAAFFRRELEQFLLLARELGRDPLSFKGSYAGAMGIGQFMPSSYRAYAVDFDGDDARDLSESPADALGSVANYFKQHGWRDGEPIYAALTDTLARSVAAGNDGSHPLPGLRADAGTEVIELAGEDGPLFRLTYPNFGTILRYNKSRHYAMAVAELSEMIRAEYAAAAERPAPPPRVAPKRGRPKPPATRDAPEAEPRLGPPHA